MVRRSNSLFSTVYSCGSTDDAVACGVLDVEGVFGSTGWAARSRQVGVTGDSADGEVDSHWFLEIDGV